LILDEVDFWKLVNVNLGGTNIPVINRVFVCVKLIGSGETGFWRSEVEFWKGELEQRENSFEIQRNSFSTNLSPTVVSFK
jgi:hypothetical protein